MAITDILKFQIINNLKIVIINQDKQKRIFQERNNDDDDVLFYLHFVHIFKPLL